ncbi:MAG: hypothetical protein QGF00_17100 [Planctomycetota bacterium]|jgi:hypothetical protein|nr:hypothetical protein [Planctomycetota bacterium]MDP7251328.1 hypothetical protein [Planctomycetota bacterium]
MPENAYPIEIRNRSAGQQWNELEEVGLPFPQGAVPSTERLRITDADDRLVNAQFRVTSLWCDGSVRWALARWVTGLQDGSSQSFQVLISDKPAQTTETSILSLKDDEIYVDTGELCLVIQNDSAAWLKTVGVPARPDGEWQEWSPDTEGGQLFCDVEEEPLRPTFDGKPEILDNGPVAGEVLFRGAFYDEEGLDRVRFVMRLVAHRKSHFVRLSLTLQNPRQQPRDELGHFRLGLPGAVLIRDAGIRFSMPQGGTPFVYLAGEPDKGDYYGPLLNQATLYQDSSGGENWHHRNHVNRDWHITTSFRGFQISADGIESYSGDRSRGWGAVGDQRFGLAVGVEKFWQNFPNAIRGHLENGRPVLTCSLFPMESRFLHELQGGEQKTHHMIFSFHRTDRMIGADIDNRPNPMVAYPTLKQAMEGQLGRCPALPLIDQIIGAGVVQPTAPYDADVFDAYEKSVASYTDDPDFDLYTLREKWDEYGWRNFGDIIADCELGGQILSHYNLEYDFSRGMLLQALRRSGRDERGSAIWADLGIDAARHQADIDIYHTKEDPHGNGVYNGGKFVHTAHALEVGRSGHRGQDSLAFWGDLDWPWGRGGGPESGHFDNEGMMLAYHLTGDPVLLAAAIEIADLVVYKVLNDEFAQFRYDRTSGNSTSVCAHAWVQTWEDRYLQAIEKILDETRLSKQAGERPVDADGLCPIGGWSASIFLKGTLWFISQYEQATGERHEKAREIVREYRLSYHRYGWCDEAGLPAETVHPDPSKNRYIVYDAAWHTVDALTWAALLEEDDDRRDFELGRMRGAFEKYCANFTPDGLPKYRSTKTATYTTNNGHSMLFHLNVRGDGNSSGH